MADNVLGVLFQDIADAIRTKTGGTDTMKPNEFPTQIANIPVGGGGGGTLVAARGSFTASSHNHTITHGLGTVPIITAVFQGYDMSFDTAVVDEFIYAVGLRKDVENAMYDGGDHAYIYYADVWQYGSASARVDNSRFRYNNEAYEVASTSAIMHSVNENTAVVGSYTAQLQTGKQYHWFAIGFKENE
jgi:hypothetical protein